MAVNYINLTPFKMATNNLIATPNVEGNIGSCQTSKITVVTGRNVFTKDVQTITTNSCNGEVEKFNHWEFSGIVGFAVFCFIVIAFISIGIATDGY